MTFLRTRVSWWSWTEPWYFSYGVLGVSAAGLAPILLPLAVGRGGTLTEVGLVMAVFNLGGLLAPIWGGIADRKHWYRSILTGGLVATSLGCMLFPFATSLPARLLLSFVQGAGATAAATVGNMLVVEAHPRAEWDKRIGWLQTFYGIGQVAGLLLSGFLSQLGLTFSLVFAGGITLLGILPATAVRTAPLTRITPRPILRHPARHAELSAGSPQRFHHHLGSNSLDEVFRPLASRFGVFLLAWLLSFAGTAGFFSLYPVLMQNAFDVPLSLSSTAFAGAAAVGLTLYAPAGRWSERIGPLRLLESGLGIRLIAFAGLLAITTLGGMEKTIPALVGFLLIVLAWSLLSVAGTAIAARLATSGEGEALGLYNATTAIAGVVGSALGGWLAARWGSTPILLMGIIGIGSGMLMVKSMLARSLPSEDKTR